MTFLFLSTFLFYPVFLYFILSALKVNIRELNLSNIIVFFLILFSYIGIVVLYFELDSYRFKLGVNDKEIITRMLLYSIYGSISLIAGLHILPKRHTFYKINTYKYNKFRIEKIMLFIFILCISTLVYFINSLDTIVLFASITGQNEDLILARSNMTNNYTGISYGWVRFILHDLLMFVSLFFWSNYKINGRRRTLTWIITIACVVSLLLTGQKAPIVWYLLAVVICIRLSTFRPDINVKALVWIFGIVIVILSAAYFLFMRQDSWSSILASIFSRAFAGSIMPAYFHLKYIPSELPYLLGRTMPNPLGILPFEPIEITKVLHDMVFPKYAQLGIQGSMPTVYWVDIFANFGPIAIGPISLIIGFYISLVDRFFRPEKSNPLEISFYVLLIFWFNDISVTTHWIIFVNVKLWFLISLYFTIKAIMRMKVLQHSSLPH